MRTTCVTLSLVVMFLAVVVASPTAAAPEPQMRLLTSLLTEINTWNLVSGLDLSEQQMQALLPVAREVRSEHEAIEAERVRSLDEFERGVRALREELLANNGVSDEAKAAVYRAEAGWKEIEAAVEQRQPERFRVVQETLTPEQMQFLAAYEPGSLLKAAAPEGALAKAEQLLARARQLTPEQLQQAPQRVRQMLPPGVPPARLRAIASQVRDMVMEARAMSDAEFEASKGDLARRLVNLLPARTGRLARGRMGAGPRPDMEAKVNRGLLTPALATVLESKLGIAQPGALKPPATYPEDVADIVTDARVLNLVNSLYLTEDQMRALSAIIARAEAEREAAKPQTEALLQSLISLATQVRGELATGGISAQRLEQVRIAAQQGLGGQRGRQARMTQYVGDVKNVLNENQIVLVSQFIPCLVPVRNLTNPERIGQAQNTEGAERMLSAARTMPEAHLEVMMPRAQARIEALLRHKHVPSAEIEAKVAELPQVVRDARAMTDAEFELKKTELIKRVAPPEPAAVQGPALDRRIAEYLLSANLVPIFEQRISGQGVALR